MCKYYAHAFSCKHVSFTFARYCNPASRKPAQPPLPPPPCLCLCHSLPLPRSAYSRGPQTSLPSLLFSLPPTSKIGILPKGDSPPHPIRTQSLPSLISFAWCLFHTSSSSSSFASFSYTATVIQTPCNKRQVWHTINLDEPCDECRTWFPDRYPSAGAASRARASKRR